MRLARHLRTGSEVSDPIVQSVLRRCREEMGIVRPVRLLTVVETVGPAMCGVFRATVIFPAKLLQELSPDELRLVLLHELIHVRRWDVLIDRVAVLVAAVHWFNPMAWLTLACLRRERELACDA